MNVTTLVCIVQHACIVVWYCAIAICERRPDGQSKVTYIGQQEGKLAVAWYAALLYLDACIYMGRVDIDQWREQPNNGGHASRMHGVAT